MMSPNFASFFLRVQGRPLSRTKTGLSLAEFEDSMAAAAAAAAAP
jgi:hypothetical protein